MFKEFMLADTISNVVNFPTWTESSKNMKLLQYWYMYELTGLKYLLLVFASWLWLVCWFLPILFNSRIMQVSIS